MRGDCRTHWIQASASKRSVKHCRDLRRRKFSTRTKAANSHPMPSRACCAATTYASAWTAKAVTSTTFLSSDYGAHLNMKTFIPTRTIRCQRLARELGTTSTFSIINGRTQRLVIKHQRHFMMVFINRRHDAINRVNRVTNNLSVSPQTPLPEPPLGRHRC